MRYKVLGDAEQLRVTCADSAIERAARWTLDIRAGTVVEEVETGIWNAWNGLELMKHSERQGKRFSIQKHDQHAPIFTAK
jgi:hypothetical protein